MRTHVLERYPRWWSGRWLLLPVVLVVALGVISSVVRWTRLRREVERTVPTMHTTGPLHVSPGHTFSYEVSVRNLLTGLPCDDLRLQATLNSGADRSLWLGEFTARADRPTAVSVDWPELPFRYGESYYLVLAGLCRGILVTDTFSVNGRDPLSNAPAVQLIGPNPGVVLALATDASVYPHGQTVHYRAIAITKPGDRPVASSHIVFEITSNRAIHRHVATTSTWGIAAGSFTIDKGVWPGTLEISAAHRTSRASRQFEVIKESEPNVLVASDPSAASPSASVGEAVPAEPDRFEVDMVPESAGLVSGHRQNVVVQTMTAWSGKPQPAHLRIEPGGIEVDTDIHGIAKVELTPGNHGMSAVNARLPDGRTYLRAVKVADGWRSNEWSIETDRTLYHPGDVVTVRVATPRLDQHEAEVLMIPVRGHSLGHAAGHLHQGHAEVRFTVPSDVRGRVDFRAPARSTGPSPGRSCGHHRIGSSRRALGAECGGQPHGRGRAGGRLWSSADHGNREWA